MGREDHVPTHPGWQQAERPGVDHHRRRVPARGAQHGRHALALLAPRDPRPEHPRLHATLGGHDLGVRRHDGVAHRGGAEVAHHRAAGTQRARHREHGGAGVVGGSGHDAEHAARVLVVQRPGHGPQRGDVGRGKADDGGAGRAGHPAAQRQPQVDHVHHARQRSRRRQQQPGLGRAERHGAVGREHGARHGAVVHPDPARHVHRDDARPGPGHRQQPAEQLDQPRRRPAQPAARPDPQQPVEHDVGRERLGDRVAQPDGLARCLRPDGQDPAAGGAQGRQAAVVHRPGGDSDRAHPVPREQRQRVQRVATVVATADQPGDRGARHAHPVGPQLAPHRGGQRPGGPVHQPAGEAPLGGEQGPLRGTDVGSAEGLDHGSILPRGCPRVESARPCEQAWTPASTPSRTR